MPVALLLLVLGSVVGVACGWNPVAPSTVAVPSLSAPVAMGGTVIASGRPAASCSNINAIVAATLGPGGTATGTISGDINGAVSAAIHAIDAPGGGRGALHVQMEHHYTNTTPFGRIDTSDLAVLAPMDKRDGTYRMNNRLTVVGGEGIYSGASGYIETHGSVDFVTGSISLTLKGRICS